ncbi:MAG: tetratricopeptide repeat protein [Acidobacteriota bacterium]|nr:tetratricopeptide repeat protein [Acidobacteriota bacterium]
METRGVVYEDKGEIGQAIVDYRKALELNPNDKTASRNLNKILK